MPKCTNCDKYFTGKEVSPRGLGVHAFGEEVGHEQRGKDSGVWHVADAKCGKRWVRGHSPDPAFVRYVRSGQVVEVDVAKSRPMCAMWWVEGMTYTPVYRPYASSSTWCAYSYERVDATHIRIVPNDMGIPMCAMLLTDFIRVYKTYHGQFFV
jgi:hypothetical protein